MKITVSIGDCKIQVSDSDANEPATAKWSDQHQRIIETMNEAVKLCEKLYDKQSNGYDKE